MSRLGACLLAVILSLAGGTNAIAQTSTQAATPQTQAPADPHAGHVPAAAPEGTRPPPSTLPAFIPPLTDEDRGAAFPDAGGHAAHDRVLHSFVLFDQLEWVSGDNAVNMDSSGWFGGDQNRLWFRVEGEHPDGGDTEGRAQLLFGHQFTRWWDVVAGFRQDFGSNGQSSWVGAGLQGLAPYFFEVEASAYASIDGQLEAWLEVEYALLVTNRMQLEPRIEAHFLRADPARHPGPGLSTADLGLRLRYQIRREFAPYVGVTWRRGWGGTAAADDTRTASGARLVSGIRLWF
jgi:copper resistance protein B